ncbi:MAG: hypothetical protein GX066_08785 [Clostridiaceae bacterium]|nr:hypothetical protein [Clostridiaceae bacterium]
MSKKKGEIKKFLDKHYEKESYADENVIEWIYVYRNIMQAMDMIDVAMDYREDNPISLWVQIDDDDIVEVTKQNRKALRDEIIRRYENTCI